MAAPALGRTVPAALGPLWGCRARCSAAAAEQARLRARRHKEERQRRRREKEEAAGEEGARPQVPTAPPKGWIPKSEVEYQQPLEPDGKKATGGPLPPTYSPRYVEAAWYEWWEKGGLFTPPSTDAGGGRVLSLVLPPPNVTGSLHLGHALTVTLQDVLVRWRRAQGWTVLWVPGTDHAGIATQAVVERWLWHQRGLRRQDLTRSEFLDEVWAWKQRHGDEILRQLRALGASLDWSRCAFTMDPAFSRAVTEAFVRLHRDGLIHRDRRLVSWSCALRSAVADVEVESRALSGPTRLRVPGCPQPVTFGVLVTFAYPVEGEDGLELPVATTRPETLLGDVAVAVHPEDPRYRHLHGRRVRHPFTERLLPIITDPSVEPTRGTGAVKVTPGHSVPDLALARAHALSPLCVIADDGTLCPPGGGWLQGVHRFVARDRVVAALAERRLLRGTQDHAMTLPVCSRSGDVIEYLLKDQWFLRCREMGQRCREAVTLGRLKLIPKFHEKNWKSWMDKVGDWCLSRQLWWGHRIPAYKVGVPPPGSPQTEELWVVGRDEDEARKEAAEILGCPPQEIQLHQDPDVLDTWFSSSLFPFAALGWPQETPDFRRFYPTSVLETGSDLLFFWVARMVMLGQELTGRLPFNQVLLHSLVRDAQGRKMSKSLGNVIDPRDVIAGATLQELQEKLQQKILDPHELKVAAEGQRRQFPHGLPECGTDALRMALCSHNVHGDDVRLDISTVLSYRRFCNKVWNAVKFVLAAVGPDFVPQPSEETVPDHPLDRWLLSAVTRAVEECGRRLDALEAHAALAAVHHFWLRTFCDVYLETAKGRAGSMAAARTLVAAADLGLRLLAPFAPFLAEELWQRLPRPASVSPSVGRAPFPDARALARWRCPEAEEAVAAMMEAVRAARGLKELFGIGSARPPVVVCCPPAAVPLLRALGPSLQALAQTEPPRLLAPGTPPAPGWVAAPAGACGHLHLRLRGVVEPSSARRRLCARSHRLRQRLQSPRGGGPPHQVGALRAELSRVEQALRTLEQPGFWGHPEGDPNIRGDPELNKPPRELYRLFPPRSVPSGTCHELLGLSSGMRRGHLSSSSSSSSSLWIWFRGPRMPPGAAGIDRNPWRPPGPPHHLQNLLITITRTFSPPPEPSHHPQNLLTTITRTFSPPPEPSHHLQNLLTTITRTFSPPPEPSHHPQNLLTTITRTFSPPPEPSHHHHQDLLTTSRTFSPPPGPSHHHHQNLLISLRTFSPSPGPSPHPQD
ncbi:valine--tRNA ligase, mitochondrial, partial [Cuculus canorus]|uniref:valine--tRNA ligase, mitochondrial n=1 Tax=Cuculus canorus TaxID=55661 RepID=UPI0023AB48A9